MDLIMAYGVIFIVIILAISLYFDQHDRKTINNMTKNRFQFEKDIKAIKDGTIMVDFRGKVIKLGDIGVYVDPYNKLYDGCEVVDIQFTQIKVFNDDWIVKRRVINPNFFIVME